MRAVRASPLRSWGRAAPASPSNQLAPSPRSSLPFDWNAGDPIVFGAGTAAGRSGTVLVGAAGEGDRSGEWEVGDPIVFSSSCVAGPSREQSRNGVEGSMISMMNDNFPRPSTPRRPQRSQDPSSSTVPASSHIASSMESGPDGKASQNKVAGALSSIELQELLGGIDFNDSLGIDDSGDEFFDVLAAPPPGKERVRIHSLDRRSPSPLDPSCQIDLFTPSPPFASLGRSQSPSLLSPSSFAPPVASNGRNQQRRHASSQRRTDESDIDSIAAMVDRSTGATSIRKPTLVKGKAKVIIDLNSSSDVEVVEPKSRPPPSSSTIAPIKPGWFAKPASLVAAAVLKGTAPRSMTPKQALAAKKAGHDADLRLEYPITFAFDGFTWPPNIIYTSDAGEVKRVLAGMTGPLGFDLEWDVSRRVGVEHKTALAQICDERTILLVHTAQMAAFPPALKVLIEDPTRIKLGVQIAGDARKLNRDFKHVPAGLLELNNVARTVDPDYFSNRSSHLVSLQNLCANYLGQYLAKDSSIRCGIWSGALGDSQKYYAANDVYSSLQIYLHLATLAAPSIDLSSLASSNMKTASLWRPPRPIVPHRKLAPLDPASSALRKAPTVRQLEAYGLFIENHLSIEGIQAKMSETRSVTTLTVVWHVLAVLAGDRSLEFDKARLVECVDKVQGGSKWMMMQEFEELLDAAREGRSLDPEREEGGSI